MKKIFLIISLIAGISIANGQYKEGYYKALDGKKKDTLKEAVKSSVSTHKRLEYYPLPNNWRYTDTYPELYNGNVRWWEMYSNNIYLIYSGQSPTSSFSANRMQREHSVPKSWWKVGNDVEYTPAYTDLWNLLPSDGECNQKKSNYPFGNVDIDRITYQNGSARVGSPVNGQGGGAPQVFEPADEYKGDFARGVFYMACVYDDLPWKYYMFNQNSYPTLKTWAYETMLEWHRNDPVSQKEIDRNNAVEGQQGNRNPFIDFPDLAEYIWGSMTERVFYIAEQEGEQTPIPDESYITQPVNRESLEFGQCAVGGEQTAYLEIHGMITSALSIGLSGTDRTMFSLGATTILPSQLNSTQRFQFPVTFSPTSTGQKTANLLLYGGGIQGSILVQLIGEGCDVPVLSRLTAYDPTDIAEDSYVANWSVAPEVVDYYVVTRTMYEEDGMDSETLESDVNSLKIMRQENVMETYRVQSSRLGYLSEASNSITVAPYSGIFTPEVTVSFGVETDSDGFVIIGGTDSVPVEVYDLSGRLVFSHPALTPGTHVSLPSGIYMMNSRLLNRPFKVLVP